MKKNKKPATIKVAPAVVEEFIVAIRGNGVERYPNLEAVPGDAVDVLCGAAELDLLSKAELEDLYAKAAGCIPKVFKSKEFAIDQVAYQFSRLPIKRKVEETVKPDPADSTNSPRRTKPSEKRKYAKKASKYILLPPTEKTQEILNSLAPQARTCVEIIAGIKKDEIPENELRGAFAAAKMKLNTKQEPWRIFQYYRANLVRGNIVREVQET